MNYKKEYNNVLMRAEEAVQKGCLDRNTFDAIFSQLTESEDERIRHTLIEFLREAYSRGNAPEECAKWLVWLEKQKEHQNNSDAPEKALGRDLTFPQDKDKNLDEIAQDYVDRVKEYNSEPTWDLMQTAVCYGYHYREQKEQKEQKHPDGCFTCDEYKKGYEAGRFHGFTAGYNKAIKEVEQKPAEWNEEDEKMLNLTKTQLRILQSHLSYSHSESMSDMEYSSRLLQIEKCVSWLDIRLKSLRPSWKPSEELIGCLERLIAFKNPEPEDIKGCEELLEQLRKL